jgi:hypothetical protein
MYFLSDSLFGQLKRPKYKTIVQHFRSNVKRGGKFLTKKSRAAALCLAAKEDEPQNRCGQHTAARNGGVRRKRALCNQEETDPLASPHDPQGYPKATVRAAVTNETVDQKAGEGHNQQPSQKSTVIQ